jgi:transposase InsO family protein
VARTFSTTLDTALVHNAVNMAVANRKRCYSTIVHADHGTQFTSRSFGENVRVGVFGTVGDCYDCAIESFWARLQVELLDTANGRPPCNWPEPWPTTLTTSTTANAVTATR